MTMTFSRLRLLAVACLGLELACAPIRLGGWDRDRDDLDGAEEPAAGGDAGAASSSAAGGASGGSPAAAGGEDSGGLPQASCPGSDRSISGQLLTPTGAPIADARIHLKLEGVQVSETISDAQGRYRFEELCAGKYLIEPTHAELAFCPPSASLSRLEGSVLEGFTGSPGGCEAHAILQRLRVLIYDPRLTRGTPGQRVSAVLGLQDPVELTERLLRVLEAASNGRVRRELEQPILIDEFPQGKDGFRYTPASYLACLEDPSTCHTGPFADVEKLMTEQKLCTAVDAGTVDEVWLLGAPEFGFLPAAALDPHCNRAVDVVPFGYERGLPELLAAVQFRVQNALYPVFAAGAEPGAPNPIEVFTRRPNFVPGAPASGCGDDTTAPNAFEPGVFDSLVAAPSYCNAFLGYPLGPRAVEEPITCAAWGCTELGYRRFWLAHLPRAPGANASGKLNDFWHYSVSRDARESKTNVTCSSSYERGWCDQLVDKDHGKCNVHEWAVARELTERERASGAALGWVELSFPEPKAVMRVQIYDRACAERVLAGHLEFSDGSPPMSFGPLEGTGSLPSNITFPVEKVLSWVRVVIDEIENGTLAGLGEIVIE